MRIPLLKLFAQSPLPHITALMRGVVECCEEVPTLMQHLVDGDQAKVVEVAKELSRLEAVADDLKNVVRDHVPIRLMLPVDRRDLLSLVGCMDSVADVAEDVGVLLTIREMEVPEPMKALIPIFVERIMATVRTAEEVVGQLPALIDAGFRGRPAKKTHALIEELSRKEHEADKIQDQLAKVLFQHEDQMSPVAVFMWTKVLNKLGDLANHAENVGDRFRLFIAT